MRVVVSLILSLTLSSFCCANQGGGDELNLDMPFGFWFPGHGNARKKDLLRNDQYTGEENLFQQSRFGRSLDKMGRARTVGDGNLSNFGRELAMNILSRKNQQASDLRDLYSGSVYSNYGQQMPGSHFRGGFHASGEADAVLRRPNSKRSPEQLDLLPPVDEIITGTVTPAGLRLQPLKELVNRFRPMGHVKDFNEIYAGGNNNNMAAPAGFNFEDEDRVLMEDMGLIEDDMADRIYSGRNMDFLDFLNGLRHDEFGANKKKLETLHHIVPYPRMGRTG